MKDQKKDNKGKREEGNHLNLDRNVCRERNRKKGGWKEERE